MSAPRPRSYLRFWGVRGSYPAPYESHLGVGGNTSCVEIRVGAQLLVCDAGSGVIPLGNELLASGAGRQLDIALTHYHWDHISGLPFFVPAFIPGWRITFYGPGNGAEEVEHLIAEQMKAPYFPVETETWLADIEYRAAPEAGFSLGPIQVRPVNVHHPGSTLAYRIEACGKTIVYASDNELGFIDRSIEERMDEFEDDERALMVEMREAERGRTIELMSGVDILIHDAQYTPEDYARKRGWGHSCYLDTVRCALEAGVSELYLFHVDPSYPDTAMAEIEARAQALVAEHGAPMRCRVAREGAVIALE